MHFKQFEKLISEQRLLRYKVSCNYDTRRTVRLYRSNIRLSQAFLAALSIFEIVLRNKIDLKYKIILGKNDWLASSILPGGNVLLSIFPNVSPQSNQKKIFSILNRINSLRNRVAHHEPICFGEGDSISTNYAKSWYQEIFDLLVWMDIHPKELFFGISPVLKEIHYIERI